MEDALKLRAMVVDDEPELAFVVAQLLQPQHEVVLARNGLEALERLDAYEPDFIIMDVMMPVLDGFDTTRAIKKHARFADVPVLFLTARSDNEAVRNSMMAGGDMFLNKPFQPDEFLAHLDELLNKQQLGPKPKQYSLEFLEHQFSNADSHADELPSRPRTLSEQLQDVASEPRLRLLVVDDDLDIVTYMQSLLQPEFEVITTTESENALDKILAYQPDILILDIMMPKLSGFHLSHLIRLNKRLRGAKVIFCSSRIDREYVEQAFRLGASEFLEKPFTPEQLRRKIFEVTRKPDFQRIRKRISYSEVMRREGGPS
jgi:DNA-binding response OmpR family regulator